MLGGRVKQACSIFLASAMAGIINYSSLNPSYSEMSRYVCNSVDSVTAGNLYFYDNDDFLSDAHLMQVLEKIQDNFCTVGIRFPNAGIFRNKNFPKLKGLDLLIVLDQTSRDNFTGRFAIGMEYLSMKSRIRSDYGRKTAKAHIGFLRPELLIEKMKRHIKRPLDEPEKFGLIVQRGTHEIAHGLGASHMSFFFTNPGLPQKYFMGLGSLEQQSFHETDVKKMKEFIRKVKTKNSEDEEIIELRDEYLHYESTSVVN